MSGFLPEACFSRSGKYLSTVIAASTAAGRTRANPNFYPLIFSLFLSSLFKRQIPFPVVFLVCIFSAINCPFLPEGQAVQVIINCT